MQYVDFVHMTAYITDSLVQRLWTDIFSGCHRMEELVIYIKHEQTSPSCFTQPT